MIYDPEDPLTL